MTLDPSLKRLILDLLNAGHTVPAIVKASGAHKETIRGIARQAGIKPAIALNPNAGASMKRAAKIVQSLKVRPAEPDKNYAGKASWLRW